LQSIARPVVLGDAPAKPHETVHFLRRGQLWKCGHEARVDAGQLVRSQSRLTHQREDGFDTLPARAAEANRSTLIADIPTTRFRKRSSRRSSTGRRSRTASARSRTRGPTARPSSPGRTPNITTAASACSRPTTCTSAWPSSAWPQSDRRAPGLGARVQLRALLDGSVRRNARRKALSAAPGPAGRLTRDDALRSSVAKGGRPRYTAGPRRRGKPKHSHRGHPVPGPWKRRSQAVRERKTSVLRACRLVPHPRTRQIFPDALAAIVARMTGERLTYKASTPRNARGG